MAAANTSPDRYVSNNLRATAWEALRDLQHDVGRHLPADPNRSDLVKALRTLGDRHMTELAGILKEQA